MKHLMNLCRTITALVAFVLALAMPTAFGASYLHVELLNKNDQVSVYGNNTVSFCVDNSYLSTIAKVYYGTPKSNPPPLHYSPELHSTHFGWDAFDIPSGYSSAEWTNGLILWHSFLNVPEPSFPVTGTFGSMVAWTPEMSNYWTVGTPDWATASYNWKIFYFKVWSGGSFAFYQVDQGCAETIADLPNIAAYQDHLN